MTTLVMTVYCMRICVHHMENITQKFKIFEMLYSMRYVGYSMIFSSMISQQIMTFGRRFCVSNSFKYHTKFYT